MKKLLIIPLIVVLVVGFVLGSCGEPEETTTAPPPTTTTTTTAPPPTTTTTGPPPATTTTTAPPPTTTAPAGPTGTLRATTPSWIETTDPNLQTTFEYALYDHLIGTGEDGSFVPELAESWSLSDDGLAWVFILREGVKFHNGDDFTAHDAKFSLERIMEEGSMSPWIGEYTDTIASIETPSDYILVINTKFVNYQFFASIWGCPMVPKNYIEEHGSEYFNEHPIGTGPWKFVELVSGVSIEFEAVPNHWRITPEFATLIVELVPEASTSLAKLRSGETDIVAVNLDEALDMQDEGYRLQTLGNPTVPVITMLGTWASDGPLSDVRVRKALSLAVNRQEIIDEFFNGLAEKGGVIWTSPLSWGYDPAWIDTYFGYDTAAAEALLAEAGYPDAFADPVVKMYSHGFPAWLSDFILILSAYWEAIGVQTEVIPIDMGQLRGMMYAEPYPPELAGALSVWNMPTRPVSLPFLESAHGSTGNWRLLLDTEWDALYTSIKTAPDQEDQLALFRETVEWTLEAYVCPGIVYLSPYFAVSDIVGEFTLEKQYDLWGNLAGVKQNK